MHNLTSQESPQYGHDIDECRDCHETGEHGNALEYYEVCNGCAKIIKDHVGHTAFELAFTLDDVEKAHHWAREHKFRYDSVDHMLFDALRSNVISTDKWQSIY